MNSPQNSIGNSQIPSVTSALIQNNTSEGANNTGQGAKTAVNVTNIPQKSPDNTITGQRITPSMGSNSAGKPLSTKITKKILLELVSEEDIIAHYVPGFKGRTGTFTNPLTPDEENPSLSIYQHQGGKGMRLKSHNTGQQGSDIFQFVADLKNLDCKSDFSTICRTIFEEMGLSLSVPKVGASTATAMNRLPKQHTEKPVGKGILQIQTSATFSKDFLDYWSTWQVTEETLKCFGVQEVLSNKDKYGKHFDYEQKNAALYKVGDWEKIVVPAIGESKKQVFQNAGKETYIFGLEQAKESPCKFLILCEGEKDLLVLAAKGFAVVTLSGAAYRLKSKDLVLIQEAAQGRPVFIVYDNDDAGEIGACKNAELSNFRVATLPKDYNDVADYFAGGRTAEEFEALLPIPKQEAGEKKKGNSKLSSGAAYLEEVRKLYNVKERDGQVLDLTIDRVHLLKCLHALGFRTYDLENNTTTFVRIADNVIRNVSPVVIQRAFFDWLNEAPKWIDGPRKIHIDRLLNKFYAGRDSFFSAGTLTLLKKEEIVFRTDKRKEICFFFENGFVKCTDINWTLHSYTELKGYIWEEQIIKRKVSVSPPNKEFAINGVVAKFIHNICGKEHDRFESMTTVLGYLLHYYFEGMTPAILLTDSSLQGGDNGRTGKTLLSQLLGYLKPTVELAGKSFQESERFKFQEVKANTQITVLNDLPKSFNLEILFNAITEGIKVEPKNKDPYKVRSKILLTSNAPIKVEGASGRDRLKEIELSDHYNDKHHVSDDFKGKWFLSKNEEQFSEADWEDYFNTFFFCCHNYLSKGLTIPKQIHLNRRKLEHQTPEGFPEWMDDQLAQGKIKIGERIHIWQLHDLFLEEYPDCKIHQKWKQRKHFKKALIDFINLTDHLRNYEAKTDFCRADKDQFITIRI